MILINLRADGRAIAEIIKHSSKFIELPDGYHPMLDRGVIRDSRHKYPAVMLVWQNRCTPERCDDDLATNSIILIKNELIKMGRGHPSISRLFFRRLRGFFFYLFRWFYFVFFLLLVFFFSWFFMVVVL